MFDSNSDRVLAFGGNHRQLKPNDEVFNYGAVWVSDDNGKQWSRLSRIIEGGNIMATIVYVDDLFSRASYRLKYSLGNGR